MMQNPYKKSSQCRSNGEMTTTTRTTAVMVNPYKRSSNCGMQRNYTETTSTTRTVIMENPYKKSSHHHHNRETTKMIENPYKRSSSSCLRRESQATSMFAAASHTRSINNNRIISQDDDNITNKPNTNTASSGHDDDYDRFCSPDDLLCRNLDQFERDHSNYYDEFDKYCLPDHVLCEMMDEFENDGLVYDSSTVTPISWSQKYQVGMTDSKTISATTTTSTAVGMTSKAIVPENVPRPRKRNLSFNQEDKSLKTSMMELPSEEVRRRQQMSSSSARHDHHPESAFISPSPPSKKQMNNNLQSNDDSPVKPKDLSQQFSSSLESTSKDGKDELLTQMIDNESDNVLSFLDAEQKQLLPQIMMMRADLEHYVNELLKTMKRPRPDRLIDKIDALAVAEVAEAPSGMQPGRNGGISGGIGGVVSSSGSGAKLLFNPEFIAAMHTIREYGNIALHGPHKQLPNRNDYERAVANYRALKSQHEKEHGCPNTEKLYLV